MTRRLVLEFTKMQGAGNDFIVVDNRFYRFSDEELADLARRWCPRRFGVGADGVLAFAPPEDEAHDYRMRYVNADGSPATMCGNGARCLARFARDAGMEGPELVFSTDAGVYRAHVPDDPAVPVRLYVPPPRRFQAHRPLQAPLPGALEAVHYIWAGTEHLVAFVDDVSTVPVVEWGRRLRRDDGLSPKGANANFVQVVRSAATGTEPPLVRVRTYEKGVEDETLACGTGVLAAVVVAQRLKRVEGNPIAVETPGGRLQVGYDASAQDGEALFLEGPVATVFRGTLEV